MKTLAMLVAASAGIALSGAALAATGGAYVSQTGGATIYAPNTWYTTNFPIVGTVPSTAEVRSVSWSYSVGTIPSGGTFIAYLCHGSTSYCINVTSFQSGSTSLFSGRPATTAFFLYYGISTSSSTIAPQGGALS